MKLFKIDWRGEFGFSYRPATSFVLANTREEAEQLLKVREADISARCVIDHMEEIPLDQQEVIYDDYEW